MVGISDMLVIALVIGMFLFLVAATIVLNDYWQYHVIAKYQNNIGFFFFKGIMILLASMVFAGVLVRFLQVIIGGLFTMSWGGTGGDKVAGNYGTLNFPGMTLIFGALTVLFFIILLTVSEYVINNIPVVFLFGILAFFGIAWLQRLSRRLNAW